MLVTPFYGQVNMPEFLKRFSPEGTVQGGGLIIFLNLAIQIFFVVAGIFAIWQFISAGWTFMSSGGDQKAIGQARDKILLSLLGLLIMASAFVLAGVFGLIIFGDVTAILQPKIVAPPTPTPTP